MNIILKPRAKFDRSWMYFIHNDIICDQPAGVESVILDRR